MLAKPSRLEAAVRRKTLEICLSRPQACVLVWGSMQGVPTSANQSEQPHPALVVFPWNSRLPVVCRHRIFGSRGGGVEASAFGRSCTALFIIADLAFVTLTLFWKVITEWRVQLRCLATS